MRLSDLPNFEAYFPDYETEGLPETFEPLFDDPSLRLLKNGESTVVVFRRADLLELSAHPSVGNTPLPKFLERSYHISTEAQRDSAIHRLYSNLVFVKNPPEHSEMRAIFAKALTAVQVMRLSSDAERIVKEEVERAIGKEEVNLGPELTARITTRFWGAQFQMSEEEIGQVAKWADALTPAFLYVRTPEQNESIEHAMGEYLDVVSTAIERTWERGSNDLLDAMRSRYLSIEDTRRPRRFGDMVAANVFEGFHTTAVASATIVCQLLQRPAQLEAVRADHTLIPSSTVEGLRLWPPLTSISRHASNDIEFAGVKIPRGTSIVMLWAAGNRDPEAFEQPNEFKPDRRSRGDLTFGGGIHICPGRHVVRMNVQMILKGLLRPDIRLELVQQPTRWIRGSSARQLEAPYVTITRV